MDEVINSLDENKIDQNNTSLDTTNDCQIINVINANDVKESKDNESVNTRQRHLRSISSILIKTEGVAALTK